VRRVSFSDLRDLCLSGEIRDAFTHLMVFAAISRAQRGDLPAEVSDYLT
jgi:hypothetical protein